jgi:hypothetical protein
LEEAVPTLAERIDCHPAVAMPAEAGCSAAVTAVSVAMEEERSAAFHEMVAAAGQVALKLATLQAHLCAVQKT